jgi:amino acid transporter
MQTNRRMPPPADNVFHTRTEVVEADLVERLGYQQRLIRFLKPWDSFSVGFSFISITTGIFTTFGFALGHAGPRGIWTWPIVIIGQLLVAAVYGALVSKIPLAGYSYQWGSRLAGPIVGWWLGWLSFAFLSIVTISVDYALSQVALMPLIGLEYTPARAAAITAGVVALQATSILLSTRVTMRINNTAVAFELIGVLILVLMALIAAQVAHLGSWSNLWSTGTIPHAGWFAWLGPFMLATLLGGYTIVGFESSANLAEETQWPRHEIPRAMLGAVAVSGTLGMLLLIALSHSIDDVGAITNDPSPVAATFRVFFGGAEWLILSWMVLSIFACGMVIMTTNSRLIWAMSRDRRFPLHQLWARTPRTDGGPSATLLAAGVSLTILALLWYNTDALVNLFTASTLMPALLYACTTLLYVIERRFIRLDPGPFQLGAWETPIVGGALLWLVYELVILIAPAEFRPAQWFALGAGALGFLVFAAMWMLEPTAMRRRLELPTGSSDDETDVPGARRRRQQDLADGQRRQQPTEATSSPGTAGTRREEPQRPGGRG